MRSLAVVGILVVGLWPTEARSQGSAVIPVASRAVRAVKVIRNFLTAYAAEKGMDQALARLRGEGRGLRDTLAVLRDQLRAEAATNAGNRAALERQAALIADIRTNLNEVLAGKPSPTEAMRIDGWTHQAIAELEAVQADHGRRIGRLEQGQDSLHRLLATLLGEQRGKASSANPGSPNTALSMEGPKIRATLERLNLSPDKHRAQLALVLENITAQPLALALEHNGETGVFAGAKVKFSDDLTQTWFVHEVSGIRVLPCCSSRISDLAVDDLTTLRPGERLRVLMTFSDDNYGRGVFRPYGYSDSNRPTPSEFSLMADAIITAGDTPRRFTFDLSRIRASR